MQGVINISKLRSKLDNRYAGMGIIPSFKEETELYKDKKVKYVRFPNDMKASELVQLSSPVITYTLSSEELQKYIGSV